MGSVLRLKEQGNDSNAEFRILAETFSEMSGRNGVTVRPYKDPSLPIFSTLPDDKQRVILGNFRFYVEVCSEVDSEGLSLRDSPLLALRMIKKMGLSPCMDIFTKMKDNSVVEIYSDANIQIFRNLRFFEISSYSIEELMSLEWWQLFHRKDEVSREIFLWASRIFGGEEPGTIAPPVEDHVLTEVDSPLKFSMNLKLSYLSPLRLDGVVRAAVAIEEVEMISSLPRESLSIDSKKDR